MIWFIVMHLFSTLLDWVKIGQLTKQEKDLEILLLRQQLGIAERKLHKPVPSSRVERLTVAVVATKLTSATGRTALELRQAIRAPIYFLTLTLAPNFGCRITIAMTR